jgi:pimeloyl-ACP methyl ester carboxylesterase
MLAFDRRGAGPPMVLLHGTNSSRRAWAPVLAPLAAVRQVFAFDLPAHGASPATSLTPAGFAADLAAAFDGLGLRAPAVVGHSVGGWAALELAKRGRAAGVLALMPAGLWATRSPAIADAGLVVNWALGQALGPVVARSMRRPRLRAAGLRSISARPADVPGEVALVAARDAAASKHFVAHFRATRRERFEGGAAIPPDVPVHVVWGADDRVAVPGSRRLDELPGHARVETWPHCGHMVMWDRPDELVGAALDLPAG